MKQPRLMSLAESAINIVVGFGIGLGAQMLFLPMLGVAIAFDQNIAFALIMTAISMARSYLLRRLFEALHIRTPLSPAMLAVIAECGAHAARHGYTADHDDKLHQGQLAARGAVYALNKRVARLPVQVAGVALADVTIGGEAFNPWPEQPLRYDGERMNWIKGGALIVKEIERWDRVGKGRGAKG